MERELRRWLAACAAPRRSGGPRFRSDQPNQLNRAVGVINDQVLHSTDTLRVGVTLCAVGGWLAIGCCGVVVFERGRGKTIECYTDVHHIEALLYKSMNTSVISEDRSNKATLLLTILCSLLSRLQRIYRSQYFD